MAPLLQKIIATAAYGDTQVDEWLIRLGGVPNQYSYGQIRDAITGLLAVGAFDLSHDVYRTKLGLDNAERSARSL